MIDEFLEKAARDDVHLTQDEIKQVRDFLTTIKALGRIGRMILWLVVSAGAIAAAMQQVRDQW